MYKTGKITRVDAGGHLYNLQDEVIGTVDPDLRLYPSGGNLIYPGHPSQGVWHCHHYLLGDRVRYKSPIAGMKAFEVEIIYGIGRICGNNPDGTYNVQVLDGYPANGQPTPLKAVYNSVSILDGTLDSISGISQGDLFTFNEVLVDSGGLPTGFTGACRLTTHESGTGTGTIGTVGHERRRRIRFYDPQSSAYGIFAQNQGHNNPQYYFDCFVLDANFDLLVDDSSIPALNQPSNVIYYCRNGDTNKKIGFQLPWYTIPVGS